MQRVYEWRGTFASEALKAVRKFFEDRKSSGDLVDAQDRAAYVEWAVPQGDEGETVPFLWRMIQMADETHEEVNTSHGVNFKS